MNYNDLTVEGREVFKSSVIQILKSGVVDLTFEKVDGTKRTGKATLDPVLVESVIGRPEEAKPDSKPRKENPDVVRFFDVDKGEFRTFKLEKLVTLADLCHGDIFHGVETHMLSVGLK